MYLTKRYQMNISNGFMLMLSLDDAATALANGSLFGELVLGSDGSWTEMTKEDKDEVILLYQAQTASK
jgi:hypothetical protein